MKKVFNFGKTNGLNIEVKINFNSVTKQKLSTRLESVKEYHVFSASGCISDDKDDISAGQNLVDIKNILKDNHTFNIIFDMWEKYHLNDMNAGTCQQNKIVDEYFKNCNKQFDYTEACKVLEDNNLLIDNGYSYGSKWLVNEIPSKDIELIKSLFD